MSKIITSAEVTEQLAATIRNPKVAMGVAFNLLEEINEGGVFVVDGSNPFAYSLDMGVINTNYALLQNEATARRLFPSMATNHNELYMHMADEDYIGRFATPSTTVAAFIFPLADILARAVDIKDGSGTRALVIPRHTSLTSGKYTFMLQYPLVIKVLYNGTLSIYIDTNTRTPTYLPPTNILTWSKQNYLNQDYLLVDFPVQQVKIVSNVIQAISYTGYSKTFNFTDSFYHARAYIKKNGVWTEISVTHQDQVYNPNKPTVCLKVLNNTVEAYIPQIYFQQASITGTVRIDIYTTVGPLNIDLTKDGFDTLKYKFEDLDIGLTEYSTPLQRFTNITPLIRTVVSGGKAARTFAETYDRVILRSAYTEGLPITQDQMGRKITDSDYTMLNLLDSVVYKQYAATRPIDAPSDGSTVTGLSCAMQNLMFKASELVEDENVYNLNKRLTIKPEMLFMYDDGGVRILQPSETEALKLTAETNPDGLSNIVNAGQYYNTPFHYCLDMTTNVFGVRPYSMTNPKVVRRDLINTNDSLGLNIVSKAYNITYKDDGSGYIVYVRLESNASLKAITSGMLSAQLSYTSGDSSSRAWIEGKMISGIDPETDRPYNGEWLFSFEVLTLFDINANHELDISTTGLSADLTTVFDVVFVLKDYMPSGSSKGDIDTIVSRDKIPDYSYSSVYVGATQEQVEIEFGKYLKHLWRRSNTVVTEQEYRTYEEDVYAYYSKDIYKMNPDAPEVIDIIIDPVTNTVSTVKLHRKGDPILDENGVHQIAHEKGSIMYDLDGEPIPIKSQLELARYIDIMLVDGKYYFANNESSTDYYKEAVKQVTGWIDEELPYLGERALEQTTVYYYPHVSTGLIDVIVGDGTMARVRADQSLFIQYTMRRDKFNNSEIRKNLDNNTASIFMQAMNAILAVGNGVVAKSDIVTVMKRLLRDDVVDIEIKGFLDDRFESILVSDVSTIPTIGKKLVTLSNLTLQVQDDLTVDYRILDKDAFNTYTLG